MSVGAPLQESPWRQSLWNLTFSLRDVWSDLGDKQCRPEQGIRRQNFFGDSIGILKGCTDCPERLGYRWKDGRAPGEELYRPDSYEWKQTNLQGASPTPRHSCVAAQVHLATRRKENSTQYTKEWGFTH